MTCANFQELAAGVNATTQLTISPIDFPYDNESDLRLDIYNYQSQQWVNVPVGADGGANINVGGAGLVHYEWELFDNNGVRAVRTLSNADGQTAGSHPLAPANNTFPVEGGQGRNVRLYRQTSIDAGDLPATFYPGSAIKAEDLNDNFEALRKVVEEGACATTNITDGSAQLDARYWNKVLRANGGDTVPQADVAANWQSDDEHIATTAAGDERWLQSAGGNVLGGPGITRDTVGTSLRVSVDLHGTDPGLELDGNGDAAQLRALGNEVTENAGDVRLTNGPSNVTITGGQNVTVTRNNANQLTISSAAATGGATFRGTVDVDNNDTLPATTGEQNPNAVAIGDGFTVENNVAANDVTADWNTVLDNWAVADGMINSGDVILCTTAAAAGSPTDARYNLIRTGGNINTLEQVTTAGNSTTQNIVLQTGANVNTNLNSDGSAIFNERGESVDFRIESNSDAHMFFIDGSADAIGISEASPSEALDVRGNIQVGDGNNLIFQNANEDQTVSLNADNAAESYTLTLPTNRPNATDRFLRASGVGEGADQNLEWTAGGGGGGDINVEDDGVAVVASATALNFTGNGVTVTDGGGNTADIDIPFVGAAAWADVDDDGTLLGSSNVASCVRTVGGDANGDWTITFTNAMPNANYSVTTGGELNNQSTGFKTVNGFRIQTANNADTLTDSRFYFAVHALNATPPRGGTGTDAWGNFAGRATDGACVEEGSFNVASVTRNGEGRYDVLFETAMPDDGYAVTATANLDTPAVMAQYESQTVNGFTIIVNDFDGNVDDPTRISFQVNATNAVLPLTITQDQIAALLQNPTLDAWANVNVNGIANGAEGTLNGNFNIASCTRNGNGTYDFLFEEELPNANYSVVAISDISMAQINGAPATTGFTVRTRDNSGTISNAGRLFVQVAGTTRNGTLGGGADSWGTIQANGDVLAGFNIDTTASGAVAGDGNFEVRFTNPMPNANYAVQAQTLTQNSFGCLIFNVTANGFDVQTYNTNTNDPGDRTFTYAVFATDGNAGGFWVRDGQGAAEVLSPLNDDADVRIGGAATNIVLNSNGSAEFNGNGFDTNESTGINSGTIRTRHDTGATNVLEVYNGGDTGDDITINFQANGRSLFTDNDQCSFGICNGNRVWVGPGNAATAADAVISLFPNGVINCSGNIVTTGAITANNTFSFSDGANNNFINFDGGTDRFIRWNNGGTSIDVVNGGGGVSLDDQATAWSAITSESRLKDIIGDPDEEQCWNLVRDIELKRYWYKDDKPAFRDTTKVPYMGPMADWLEKQDPELVIYREPDEEGVVRSFNQGLLDMKVLQALSSALKRIEALEAKLNEKESN